MVEAQPTQGLMHWYLIHTKPRQEQRALDNLLRQGYECFLPMLAVEKLRRGRVHLVQEALFSRYLFIRLGTGLVGQGWGPIRSTQGVTRLVTFGSEPAKIETQLVTLLREQQDEAANPAKLLFTPGDLVRIKDGPFAGLQGVYQMTDGEQRAMVLLEILSKPAKLRVAPASLVKVLV
jgi:transcriptional antiterminator RfaH